MNSTTKRHHKRGRDDLWYVRSNARSEIWKTLKKVRMKCIDDLRASNVATEARTARIRAFPEREGYTDEEMPRILDQMKQWESRYAIESGILDPWASRWNLSQPWLKELALQEALGHDPSLWIPQDLLARLRDDMGLPPGFKFEALWDPLRPWFDESEAPEGRMKARERINDQFQAMLTEFLDRVEAFRKKGPSGLEEYLAAMPIMPEDFRWLVKRVVPINPDEPPLTAEQIANKESVSSDPSGGPRIQTIYNRTNSLAAFLPVDIPRSRHR